MYKMLVNDMSFQLLDIQNPFLKITASGVGAILEVDRLSVASWEWDEGERSRPLTETLTPTPAFFKWRNQGPGRVKRFAGGHRGVNSRTRITTRSSRVIM